MGYLPIFLELRGRRCLVVGGGRIAQRKVQTLLEAQAQVIVVSPTATPKIEHYAHLGRIVHLPRPYAEGDMRGAALVYAASDDPELHRRLHGEALALGVPINVADVPELSSFITPAAIRRGRLSIAISTSGASPAMARRIRKRLDRLFGVEYGVALEVLGAARRKLKTIEPNRETRTRKLNALARSCLVQYLRRGDIASVDRLLRRLMDVALVDLRAELDPQAGTPPNMDR